MTAAARELLDRLAADLKVARPEHFSIGLMVGRVKEIQTALEGQTVAEWGVRFGDGDVEFFMDGRSYAEDYIVTTREHIARGVWEADDYEPLTLMTRQHTRFPDIATDWTPASEPT